MATAERIHRMVRRLEADVRARTADGASSSYSKGFIAACVYIAEQVEEDFELEV